MKNKVTIGTGFYRRNRRHPWRQVFAEVAKDGGIPSETVMNKGEISTMNPNVSLPIPTHKAQIHPGQPLDVPPLNPSRPAPPSPADAPPVPPMLVYVKEKSTWEYKLITRNLSKEEAPTEEELNGLGADGWELAGVFGDSPLAYFYFKRARR